jgi:hypothetical protein
MILSSWLRLLGTSAETQIMSQFHTVFCHLLHILVVKVIVVLVVVVVVYFFEDEQSI